MLEVLLTVIPSLCWVVFRCCQLLRAPPDRLARQLNIQIPHTPVISVDGIAEHDISVRWVVPTQADENIFYVVLVNGQDAGTLTHSSVKLSNLHGNTLYKVQILAVNVINNFRSESVPVYVRTGSGEVQGTAPRYRLQLHNVELDVSEVQKTASEPELMSLLQASQDEIAKTICDAYALLQRQNQEEQNLRVEYLRCKKELDEGHEVRAKKGLDLKGLEKNKDSLAFRKIKLLKILRNYEFRRNIHTNKISELLLKLKKTEDKAQYLKQVARSERSRVLQALGEANRDVADLRTQIQRIEHQISATVAEKRSTSAHTLELQALISLFTRPSTEDGSLDIFSREGTLTTYGALVAAQILRLVPEWAGDFDRELEALKELEDAWRLSFRAHLRKYIAMHNSIETARCARDPTHVPAPLSEYQASVEFGGFSNALPRLKRSSPPPEEQKEPFGIGYSFTENDRMDDCENNDHRENENGYSFSRSVYEARSTGSENARVHSAPKLEFGDVGEKSTYEPMYHVHKSQPMGYEQSLPAMPSSADVFDGERDANQGTHRAGNPLTFPTVEHPYPGQYAEYARLQLDVPTPNSNAFQNGHNIYLDPYISSPVSEPSTLYASTIPMNVQNLQSNVQSNFQNNIQIQNNLQNNTWNSYLDPRSPYSGLSLLPPLNGPLHLPLSANASLVDSGFFSSLMLPTGPSHNSIWLNKPSALHLGHNHLASSGSTIWRDVGKRDFSPTTGIQREFLPFAPETGENREQSERRSEFEREKIE